MQKLNPFSKIKKRSRTGATLITVILIGLLLTVIGLIALTVSTKTSSRSLQERGSTTAFQIADSAADYVRSRYIDDFTASNTAANSWVQKILTGNSGSGYTSQLSGFNDYFKLTQDTNGNGIEDGGEVWPSALDLSDNFKNVYRSSTGAEANVRARIFTLGGQGGTPVNFVVKVTTTLPDGSEQTVVKGFSGEGSPVTPPFAILSRQVNCAFCHINVYGDVGALEHLRPGASAKSSCNDVGFSVATQKSGFNTGSGSCIENANFDFYAATTDKNAPLYAKSKTGDGTDDGGDASGKVRGSVFGYQSVTDDQSSATTVNNIAVSPITGTVGSTGALGGEILQRSEQSRAAFAGFVADRDINGNGFDKDDIQPVAKDQRLALATNAGGSLSISGGANPTANPGAIDIETGTKGGIWLVPANGTFDPNSSSQAKATIPTQDAGGTLVLVGTKQDPINLNSGEFYFGGDIILKGYVKGQATVTAGRNVYIAGDVRYSDAPGPSGVGNYSGTTGNPNTTANTPDELRKDSLRLLAGGNIVIGDYTYQQGSGSTATANIRDRQAEDYLRNQFGLVSDTGQRYFNKTTGEELITVKSPDGNVTAVNDYLGNQVASCSSPAATCSSWSGSGAASVLAKTDQQSYDYLFSPGNIDAATGNFKASLTQDQYRSLLGGTEKVDNSTWRFSSVDTKIPYTSGGETTPISIQMLAQDAVGGDAGKKAILTDYLKQSFSTQISDSETLDLYVNSLITYLGKPKTEIVTKDSEGKTINTEEVIKLGFDSSACGQTNPYAGLPCAVKLDSKVEEGEANKGVYIELSRFTPSGGSQAEVLRVVDRGKTDILKQPSRIDAFLYTNGRVAGRVSTTNLAINGGLTAREFGILSPGVGKQQAAWADNATKGYFTTNATKTNPLNGAVYDDGLNLNYDYRLKYLQFSLNNTVRVGTVQFFRTGTPNERVQ
ncbi:pilus assembly PilX N-terminal domain-containing protein [Anthocerotibacter panamensis]|uniref:pilus assembly PilX N-terminal domain-containing protein n=1 Tax=Anthocerotibacter panamensis TaxID=2857077 RepID=UPI001C40465F|nr:pilus assembly PilX N-terminal domain-containing protein [Anthocerotibacter panamensis]